MHDSANNAYKIGISNKPEYRERTLQSEKPSIVKLAAKQFPTRDIARAFEAALHKVYEIRRMRGEWFKLEPNEVEDVKKALAPQAGEFKNNLKMQKIEDLLFNENK